MKKIILKYIEKKAINYLRIADFQRHGIIDIKEKKIIFEPMGSIIFNAFAPPKEKFYVAILCKFCGYTFWERSLLFWCDLKQRNRYRKRPKVDKELLDIPIGKN